MGPVDAYVLWCHTTYSLKDEVPAVKSTKRKWPMCNEKLERPSDQISQGYRINFYLKELGIEPILVHPQNHPNLVLTSTGIIEREPPMNFHSSNRSSSCSHDRSERRITKTPVVVWYANSGACSSLVFSFPRISLSFSFST